jgi:hypothetical protein
LINCMQRLTYLRKKSIIVRRVINNN